MPEHQPINKRILWSRRQLLQTGLVGIGLAGAATGFYQFQRRQAASTVEIPPIPENTPTEGNGLSPMVLLRNFDYGTLKQEKGRTIREFQIIAENTTLQLNSAVSFNMIELDPAVTFHLHANFFRVYPTGRTLTPTQETDVITMGTTERHILEFAYRFPGQYMFHPHQDAIAEAGCMGFFDVIPKKS
ncbi:MAG: multicopper oxidase domain-containing protein [Cyanobacteria bacterium CRU_2_1]|nr:multicopper oxidase domain-containing protein [Cyanobacteria bacterium CRU_2_1]